MTFPTLFLTIIILLSLDIYLDFDHSDSTENKENLE